MHLTDITEALNLCCIPKAFTIQSSDTVTVLLFGNEWVSEVVSTCFCHTGNKGLWSENRNPKISFWNADRLSEVWREGMLLYLCWSLNSRVCPAVSLIHLCVCFSIMTNLIHLKIYSGTLELSPGPWLRLSNKTFALVPCFSEKSHISSRFSKQISRKSLFVLKLAKITKSAINKSPLIGFAVSAEYFHLQKFLSITIEIWSKQMI